MLWAQRTDEVYLTINLADVSDPQIKLSATSVEFFGDSHDKKYSVNLEFFKEIDPEVRLAVFC